MAAVHDGYVLTKALARSKFGGRLLTQAVKQVVEAQAGPIKPRYCFKRVEKTPGNWVVRGQAGVACWPPETAYILHTLHGRTPELPSPICSASWPAPLKRSLDLPSFHYLFSLCSHRLRSWTCRPPPASARSTRRRSQRT